MESNQLTFLFSQIYKLSSFLLVQAHDRVHTHGGLQMRMLLAINLLPQGCWEIYMCPWSEYPLWLFCYNAIGDIHVFLFALVILRKWEYKLFT